MPIIQLEQGSPQWLLYRSGRIMATDTPVILGSNPFKSRLELWEEKTGLREPTKLNDAMRRGQELEPEARRLASEILGISFEPCVIESQEFPWMAASLDGLNNCINNIYILEIKCPKSSTHDDAIDGKIPEYYRDQIQHQLFVTGASICYYFSYRPERKDKPYAIMEIYPDSVKQAKIYIGGVAFYKQMCDFEAPEEWQLVVRK